MRTLSSLVVLTIAITVAGCPHVPPPAVAPEAAVASTASMDAAPRRVNANHLPNAHQIHPKVISGGQPEGEEAFHEMALLGIKTIISVDGAKPEVELAKKYGLRYVHLPHGYDGIPDARVQELAKAVRDLPGPIYIHCHHGRHRSPTAAAVACVAAGLVDPASAETILKTAGTSPVYLGLYQSARRARPLEAKLLDELQAEFPSTAEIPPLAQAMVAIEHVHDHLKEIAAADWKTPSQHPDLDPPHEALLLREHFTELLRTKDVRERPERFQSMLCDSQTAAHELEDALRASSVRKATELLGRISQNCADCHRTFRDTPLREK